MQRLMLALSLAFTSFGCTTMSLERHTLEQIHSAVDCRNQQVLNCLATVAADGDALPSFALLSDGVTRVLDMGTVNANTTWTRAVASFATESLAGTLSRSPQGQWTVDPIVEHERLEALRCACRWALYGPERAGGEAPGLLSDAAHDPSPGPHFGVADRLERMPKGWLHVGSLKDVPAGACVTAHCGDTWVWVMADGTAGLAEFILVLYDIATLDRSAIYSPALLITLTRYTGTSVKDRSAGDKLEALMCEETREVKPECRHWIEEEIRRAIPKGGSGNISLTWDQWVACSVPYRGPRINVTAQGTPSTSSKVSPYLVPLVPYNIRIRERPGAIELDPNDGKR